MPISEAMNILAAKQCSGKEWDKSQKLQRGKRQKFKVNKKIRRQGRSISVSYDTAKVLDTISRLPRYVRGSSTMLFSAYNHVKMSDASRLVELPETGWPTVPVRLPQIRRPNHRDNIDDPVVPLKRNLCGHPLTGLRWEKRLEEVLLQDGWEKYPVGNASRSLTSSTLRISVCRRHQKWLCG